MARRARAEFAAMAGASFARRALAQSLAKEFGPQGVHVAHVIIDGLIQTDRVDGMFGGGEAGTRLDPADIAAVYLDIIRQKPSAWTQELDVR
jgi:NAD(P)-dependent dehydrogenase (short-subunit alcohol dehydrogenase family)